MSDKVKLVLAFLGVSVIVVISLMFGIFSVSYLHFNKDNRIANSMVQASDEIGIFSDNTTDEIEN